MHDYRPPSDILGVLRNIEFEQALAPGDARRVDTREARGSQETLGRLATKMGLWMDTGRFLPNLQKHVLFFGHVGSGKTTELKYYGETLKGTGWFLPIEVDVPLVLDRNNLQYADLVMAMANALLATLQHERIVLPGTAGKELEQWFVEKVSKHERIEEFTNEIKGGGTVEAGIPLLAKVFASFSSAFKSNATYKEELRHVIRNTFTQLAAAFNRLIRESEDTLRRAGRKEGVRVLFIVDGTDKLREEDRRRLFIEDVELLFAVETLAVYTAPIALKYEGGLFGRQADLVLPMVKLQDETGARCEAGWRVMREMLLKRADMSLFKTEQDIEELVRMSGGHPRDLLRLLQLSCELSDGRIDAMAVRRAVAELASDYRRLLEPDDYGRLVQIDQAPLDVGNDERVRWLLYRLALLEYNDGTWRRSHPVVRTLEGYRRAEAATLAKA